MKDHAPTTTHPGPRAARRLTFGIYPGGTSGTETGLATGPADRPEHINQALDKLQGIHQPLIVRGYVHYQGRETAPGMYTPHPAGITQYARNGRKLDLVCCYRDTRGDLDGWLDFVRAQVEKFGDHLAKIQITEEPNLYHAPGSADGTMPNVREALVRGVIAAKDEAYRKGYDLQVGFNAVPSFNPADDFWPSIGNAGSSFLDSLDYVGLDFFPDVFRRIEPEGSDDALGKAVAGVLDHFRNVNLPTAHLPPSIPIHITENGWPTAPDRSYERQASVLETTVRTIHQQADVLNITHYELFSLRDADSAQADLFYQFGLMRDDYTPKPAFDVFRRLIAEIGTPYQHATT